MLLSVARLNFNLTQLKERIEETASNVSHVMNHLEELKDLISNLRNDASKTNNTPQRCRQERGILKRVKEERDDEYQLLGCTQRKGKRARVTWDDQ